MKRKIVTLFTLIIACIFSLQGQFNEELNSAVYTAHKGEILFSNLEIDLQNFSNEDINTHFDLSDEVYAQIIMEKTLAQRYQDNNYVYDFNNSKYSYNYAMNLVLDGEKKARWLFELPENYFKHALTLDIALSSNDPEVKSKHSEFVNDWVEIISNAKEGERKVTLEVIPITIDLIGSNHPGLASGSFNLYIEKNKIRDFREKKSTDLPPVTMINKSLEIQILKESDDIYPYSDPLRAFITDVNGDWVYSTDENGNILSRYIVASVVYRINTSKKCWVKTGFYVQKHQGYGNFGSMKYLKDNDGYFDYELPCEKITND